MKDKLKQAIIHTLNTTPLNISQTRRSGESGLRNANEVAEELLKVIELQDLKSNIKLSRALGLTQSIVDTAFWEDVNKDGLHRIAKEIAEILQECISGRSTN